jgi:hypothetical protein
MAKQGFGGQWVQIARVGKFKDADGVERDLSKKFLTDVVENYNASEHEAPAVVGHPSNDAPAQGWVSNVRLNGDALEAQFADTDDDFESAVGAGRFKKRSASFYLKTKDAQITTPTIKHVGFLGAAKPALKGMRDIQFAEGESFVLEDTFQLQETQMGLEDKDVEKVTEGVFAKIKNFLSADKGEGEGKPAAAEFTEASLKKMIKSAVDEASEAITTEFTEKLDAANTELEKLRKSANDGTASGRKAEVAQFVEGIPASKGKHFLKRVGVAQFLERLAEDDAADEKASEAIAFSDGEGGDKQDVQFSRFGFAKELLSELPEFIQFGEKFGNLTASADVDDMLPRPDVSKKIHDALNQGGKEDKAAGGGQ